MCSNLLEFVAEEEPNKVCHLLKSIYGLKQFPSATLS